MKKRIASFVLIVIMLLSVFAVTSFALITPGKPVYGKASGYGSKFTLTGNQANDVIAVAKAQVYKKGSELGYSSAWCDAFVIDCARIANVSANVIPNKRGCKALYDAIISKGGVKVTSPKVGDVVLYYCKICKNYPHIGFYAGSGYTCEGNVGGSVSNSDRKKMFYCDGSGHTSYDTIQSLYVRPNYANAVVHTLSFYANGGSGTMATDKVVSGASFTLPKNNFICQGYTFAGWNAKRSDGKWFCGSDGWRSDNEIAANNYTKSVYSDGWSGIFNSSWTSGTTGAISVTYYAQWKRAEYTVNLFSNHSGKNYMCNSDFRILDTTLYLSRDSSVYTLSVDEGRTADYGALKIVGSSAGSSSKDLVWCTSTMGGISEGYVGDNKTMTLSFWAKSSVAGAKLYIRFGYQSTDAYETVSLTTDWKKYSITFVKDEICGSCLHPYFDKAGTFYISELQLEDGGVATSFVVEPKAYTQMNFIAGQSYSGLPVAKRDGYAFEGWYTSASGGTKITDDTDVMYGRVNFYAHWSKVEAHKHIYTNACDNSCNICDAKRTSQHAYSNACDTTCNVCGGKRSISHSYKTSTSKATLTKNGKSVTECSICGNVKSSTAIYSPKTFTLSATKYTYNGKVKTPSVTVKDSKGKVLKKDTDYTVKYESGRKLPGKYTVTVTFKGKYSGTKKLNFNIIPEKIKSFTVSQTTDTVTIKWSKIAGVDAYRVYKYNSKTKKYDKVTDVKGTSVKIKSLKSGTVYNFKVRGYKKDEETIGGVHSDEIITATKCRKTSIKKITSSGKKINLTWSKISEATGYQVVYSTSKNFTESTTKKVNVKKASTIKATLKSLRKGKKYYVKVRAYKTADGKKIYSAYSAVKNVKVK